MKNRITDKVFSEEWQREAGAVIFALLATITAILSICKIWFLIPEVIFLFLTYKLSK